MKAFKSQNWLAFLLPLFFALSATGQGNIVANGGFETLGTVGEMPPWRFQYPYGGVFGEGPRGIHAPEGRNFIIFSGLLYQDLVAVPGQSYSLQFLTSAKNAGSISVVPFDLRVSWEGKALQTISVISPDWQRTTFPVVATTSSPRLSFECLGPQLTSSGSIDAIWVLAVPEPSCLLLFAAGLICACIWHS